jgi:hypothetical protein
MKVTQNGGTTTVTLFEYVFKITFNEKRRCFLIKKPGVSRSLYEAYNFQNALDKIASGQLCK